MSEIMGIDDTLYVFSEIFSLKESETKFDKIIERIKAF